MRFEEEAGPNLWDLMIWYLLGLVPEDPDEAP